MDNEDDGKDEFFSPENEKNSTVPSSEQQPPANGVQPAPLLTVRPRARVKIQEKVNALNLEELADF